MNKSDINTEDNMKKMLTIDFEVRELNEEDRSFLAVGSTEAEDRHGEFVMQDGWAFDNFLKNPVLPWGHDYYNPPMARATEIGVLDEGGKKKLMFRAQFPSIEELSSDSTKPSDWALFVDSLYNAYKNGYLRAWSVGFISKQMDGLKHKTNELLEISGVTIPSNPEALTLAYKDGVIDKDQVEASVRCMKSSIESLTKSINDIDNIEKEDIDMDKVKELEDKVKQLEARLKELDEAATDDGTEQDVDAQEGADTDNPEDKEANADDTAGAADEDESEPEEVEVSDDEVQEAFERGIEKAKAEATGKVD